MKARRVMVLVAKARVMALVAKARVMALAKRARRVMALAKKARRVMALVERARRAMVLAKKARPVMVLVERARPVMVLVERARRAMVRRCARAQATILVEKARRVRASGAKGQGPKGPFGGTVHQTMAAARSSSSGRRGPPESAELDQPRIVDGAILSRRFGEALDKSRSVWEEAPHQVTFRVISPLHHRGVAVCSLPSPGRDESGTTSSRRGAHSEPRTRAPCAFGGMARRNDGYSYVQADVCGTSWHVGERVHRADQGQEA